MLGIRRPAHRARAVVPRRHLAVAVATAVRAGSRSALVGAAVVVLAFAAPAPLQAAATGTGQPPPAPPPPCTIGGTAYGTDLRAEFDTRFNVDLPPEAISTAATTVMDGYPSWSGSLSNASPSVVSHPTISFNSGLDPTQFVTPNDGAPLASFPFSCGLPSLTTGQQMQSSGIEQRAGTPPGQRVTQPLVRDTLGYDSSRSVAPLALPPGGGEQTITVSLTPRDTRFATWSWISIFIDSGPQDTVVSLTPPSNLDQGETLLSDSGRPSWSLVAGVLGKTYVFRAVVRYASPFAVPWTHVPGVQIYAFTQVTPCNFCFVGPSVSIAIPHLDGATPGAGRVTFGIDETTHTWWDVATKRSYAAKYFGGYIAPASPCPSSVAGGRTIHVVTNTTDSGPCSLRAAMEASNSDGTPSTIVFNIPTTDPGCAAGVCTIRPLSPLPPLVDGRTTIDGSTQGDTNPLGPSIAISGSLAGGGSGLALWSDGNKLNDLVVNGFTGGGAGIDIRGSNNSVIGSYVGVDATGTIAVENRFHGISIFSGTGNVIGGPSPAERNVISGNNGQGVDIHSSRNAVRGNFIGTDRTGTLPLGNGLEGVFIWPCPYAECGGPAQGNVIGGAGPGDRNVISGNSNNGVWVQDSSNLVQGNFVGTDVTGTLPLGNRHDGIRLVSGPASCGPKGGCVPASNADGNVVVGNLVSANAENGIDIARFADTGPTSDQNVIQGNYIGTDVTGLVALGNLRNGVAIRAGSNNTIGGTTAGSRNVISGNGGAGVVITGAGATGNVIQGNFIGTTVTGSAALPNGSDGIALLGGDVTNTLIGGTAAGVRNVISANLGRGIVTSDAFGSVIRGNFIGTDATGTQALGNGSDGIGIGRRTAAVTNTLIGGTDPGAGNLISGNGVNPLPKHAGGISLGGVGDSVQGNLIGTDVTGTRALPNLGVGVGIPGNAGGGGLIGGTTSAARNVISGNGHHGVGIFGGSHTVVQGNFIGTDVTGARPLGNALAGVGIDLTGGGNVVGGTVAGSGNVISANRGGGLAIHGSSANLVQGNLIGTDVSGTAPLGNGGAGVSLASFFAPLTTNAIGGAEPGAGNVISANGQGVVLRRVGFDVSGNTVQGNYIGTDATGLVALGNRDGGVALFGVRANTIGGAVAGARNVISGNGFGIPTPGSCPSCSPGAPGILIQGSTASDNLVLGNYIGVDRSGIAPLGNSGRGILVSGAPGNFVGGPRPGEGNVIGSNGLGGVVIARSASVGNRVEGNFIGTDASGTQRLGNGGAGAGTTNGASDNVIRRNVIAFNRSGGVAIYVSPLGSDAVDPVRNRVSENAIYENTSDGAFVSAGLGIDLAFDGVTPNDPGDADTGPNGLQNYPVLVTAEVTGAMVTVTGTLDTQSPSTATVELFGNDVADPSGYGEGQRFSASVAPAPNGCFSVTFPASAADRFFTSTATDAAGDTSEFSRAIPYGTSRAAIALAPATATNVVGTTHTVTATLTNTASGPVPCAVVTFTVTGANSATGSGTTDINGTTTFTYTGVWAGEDTIAATSGPATGTATKTLTFPASTAGSVTGGGQVPTPTSTASFGIIATGASGQLEFNEKAGRNVHSTRIAATVIRGTHATVYGFASVDGAGDVQFRVDVDDLGGPGTSDTFRIVMRDGYTAGGALQRGNLLIH